MFPVLNDQSIMNYVVVGDVRSGTTVVQSSLSNRRGAVCHADLLHWDQEIRRAAHEGYFGPAPDADTDAPGWLVDGGPLSPWHYLNHAVFDHPERGEVAVGLRAHYAQVCRWELWDLFEARFREGDFCLVHVRRNPVACLVSLKQAERSGIWQRGLNEAARRRPAPVRLDPDELVGFCRAHAATAGKLRAACADKLEVSYRDLCLDYQATMRQVFDFLELPDSLEPAQASCRRLRNLPLHARILNEAALRASVPSDVRMFLDAEDLF